MPKVYKKRYTRRPKRNLFKYVKGVINKTAETKMLSNTWTSESPTSSSPTLDQLFAVGRGTHDNQRVGNQVQLTKMRGRLIFTYVPGVNIDITDTNILTRMIIVQSKRGALTGGDLFYSGTPSVHGALDLDKVHVIKDKLFNIAPAFYQVNGTVTDPEAGGGRSVVMEIKTKKYLKRYLQFDDAGTVSNNPMYIYILTNNANAYVSMDGYIVNYYKDY